MSSEIKTCPQCQAFILDDAAVCPDCDCSLEETPQLAEQPSIASVDIPCPKCGEMVAHGSVRCWSCMAFMQSAIEAASEKQQAVNAARQSIVDVQQHSTDSMPQATAAVEEASVASSPIAPAPVSVSTAPLGTGAAAIPDELPTQDDGDFDLRTSMGDAESFTASSADFELVDGMNLLDEVAVPRVAIVAEANAANSAQLEIPELVPLDDSAEDTPPVQTSVLPPIQDVPTNELPPVQGAPAVQVVPPVQTSSEIGDEVEVAHSVATGGDLLWQIAMEEESHDDASPSVEIPTTDENEAVPSATVPEVDAANTATETEVVVSDEQAVATTVASNDEPPPASVDSQQEANSQPAAQQASPRAAKRKPATMLVFCPMGHRINVPIKFQGRQGRCPKCKEPIFVPALKGSDTVADNSQPASQTESSQSTDSGPTSDTGEWIRDVHMHAAKPDSVKLKPGSLAADFVNVDLRFGDGVLLVVQLIKKKGLFGNASKQADSTRQSIDEHIASGKPLADLIDAGHLLINDADVKQTRVVEPVVYEHESLFKAVPVFGEKQIAVLLNSNGDASNATGVRNFLSFGLTKFRRFSGLMASAYGVNGVGLENGIPLADQTVQHVCHYSEASFEALSDSAFHREDEDLNLKLVGWRCESCELIVSEDSRKKEKIGGLSGKNIAKAKCPKCEERFGNHPLHVIEA